eukprot:2608781-Rhodomonas_salina.1
MHGASGPWLESGGWHCRCRLEDMLALWKAPKLVGLLHRSGTRLPGHEFQTSVPDMACAAHMQNR